jgi:hypothetical protein
MREKVKTTSFHFLIDIPNINTSRGRIFIKIRPRVSNFWVKVDVRGFDGK